MEVSEITVKLVAGTLTNETALAQVKPVPVTVTVLPPTIGYEQGDTPVTVAARSTPCTGQRRSRRWYPHWS